MARKPTGRPPGRPKTKDYETLLARVPSDLAAQVKRYAGRHRCSVAELIRDGLVMRLDAGEVPGRSPMRRTDNGDTPPNPENGDTGIHELSPMLHAAIAAAVRETMEHVQSRPHGEQGEGGIHQPIPVVQHDTGQAPYHDTGADFDHEKFSLGKLCPKSHMYGDTGMSLLRRHNQSCRECENQAKREKRARHKAAQVQEG